MNKIYKIVETVREFDLLCEKLNSWEYVTYDTETTGLNVRKDTVIGIAISGTVGEGYYLPLNYWEDNVLKDHENRSYNRQEILLNILKSKKLIMHNGSYDCRITYHDLNVDLTPSLYCDTILLKHTVDEERPFGLKDIAKKIQSEIGLDVSEEANKEQIAMVESIKANGGSVTKDSYELYKADMNLIGIYACADADLTLRVYEYYSKKLQEEKLEKFFYQDEVMPLYKEVTIPMEMKGIPVDLPALETSKLEIRKDIEALEIKIQSLISPYLKSFSEWFLNLHYPPRRSGSFAQSLCEHVQLNLPKTESGRFSLTEKNLNNLVTCTDLQSKVVDYLLGGDYLDSELVSAVQDKMFSESEEKYMFNLSSKHHLKKLFFEELGETPVSKTDKGNPQVDHLFLNKVKDQYAFVPLLLDYNKLCKLEGAYIDRFLNDQEDGMFYPRFNQHRTISGRYGSDIQQLPRPIEPGQASEIVIKHTNKMRKFFISGLNHVFVDADYESLEPHVFAHVSGDQGLKDIFLKGNDFYSTIAIATEGLEGVTADKKADDYLGKINKPLRQKAKAYSLGIPYGMEGFKLSKTIGVSQKEADKLIEKYLNAYPNLKAWMERSNDACVIQGRVSSEAGRVRHMPQAPKIWYGHGSDLLDSLKLWKKYHESPKKYEQMKYLRRQMNNYLNNAKNFQIQSLAASITNRACIAINRELNRLGIKGYICCQIHDQIVVRVPKKDAKRCQRMVQYLMENTYKLSIPLKAPAEIGLDLYEAH